MNIANYRYWPEKVQCYFDEVLYQSDAFSGSSMRWNAAMVGDVHRIISRGGLFLYPQDARSGNSNGKIRLLYEANPLALLVEKSGGLATSLGQSILTIEPTSLHQRVPVAIGSKEQVEYYNKSTI